MRSTFSQATVVTHGAVLALTASVIADCAPWSPMGNGLVAVTALATLNDGSVVAGCPYVAGPTIQRWNGSTWTVLGTGVDYGVSALVTMPNGDLIAGGAFTTAGGNPARSVARWDGNNWHAMGTGLNGEVRALAVGPNGELYAGGLFSLGNQYDVAMWTGNGWAALGGGFNGGEGYIFALAVMPNGDVVAGGNFNGKIRRWDGSTWTTIGGGVDGAVYALAVMPNGDLVAGGAFLNAGSTPARRIARWNGSAWSSMANGMVNGNFNSEWVGSLKVLANGQLVAGGLFEVAGSAPASSIARWDGTHWWPLGGGVKALNTQNQVRAISVTPSGVIIAGGVFNRAGASLAANVASHILGPNTCLADFDCSNTLGADDVFEFLNAWFDAHPYADFNGRDGTDVQDIFEFLNAWFAGCP